MELLISQVKSKILAPWSHGVIYKKEQINSLGWRNGWHDDTLKELHLPSKYSWFLTLEGQLGDIAHCKMCYESMFTRGPSLGIVTKQKP